MYREAELDPFYQEVIKVVEEVEWHDMAAMPRKSEAQKMLHKYRQKWETMSVMENEQGQKLVQLDGPIFPPKKARERILEQTLAALPPQFV